MNDSYSTYKEHIYLKQCMDILCRLNVLWHSSSNVLPISKVLILWPHSIITSSSLGVCKEQTIYITTLGGMQYWERMIYFCLRYCRGHLMYVCLSETLFTNYRLTSLLPTISKIFEKVIFKQIYSFFSRKENLL